MIKSLSEEEDFWRQRARKKWLQDEDCNTWFFHDSIATRRARMYISQIKNAQGDWIDDVEVIKQHVVGFLQDLLTQDYSCSLQVVEDVLNTCLLWFHMTIILGCYF